MRPISRPKKVRSRRAGSGVAGRRDTASGRSNRRAPSGREQVRVESAQMCRRPARESNRLVEDRVDHREQAVVHAGVAVVRMQQVLHGAVAAKAQRGRRRRRRPGAGAGSRLVCRPAWPRSFAANAAWRPTWRSACASVVERLVVQGHGPRAAQVARASPGRPAAASRSSRRGRRPPARCRRSCAARSARARARRAPDRAGACRAVASRSGWKNGSSVEDRRVAAREQVLGEREQRPEHDVAVRVAGADAALALEEHEPLRPVAVAAFCAFESRAATGRASAPCAEREQQLDRTLADVARAPAAARELLEAARREIVDQRVVRAARAAARRGACRPASVRAVGRHGDRQVVGGEAFRRRRRRRSASRHVGPFGDEAADDREAERARGRGLQHQVRLVARARRRRTAARRRRRARRRLVARRSMRQWPFGKRVASSLSGARREHDRAAVALRASPGPARCRRRRSARRAGRRDSARAGPSTTSMSRPSACGSLRASLRTSMRPPAWR